MTDDRRFRHVCVLLHDGHVLTDGAGGLPSSLGGEPEIDLATRARACGDPDAVLVAPEVEAGRGSLTLLSVFGPRSGSPVDGAWMPMDEVTDDNPAVLAFLREIASVVGGVVDPPARRPAWFHPGWYDEVDAWIDHSLAARRRVRTGPTVPAKVWSLSAVLRVPCDPAPVWFKASCRHFHAEPALTRLVGGMLPEHTPPVVAADEERAWLLMDEMSGADEEQSEAPPEGLGPAAARIVATLQLRSLEHLEEIQDAGVAVRGLTETWHGFEEILAGSIELDELTPEELATAREHRGEVRAVFDELAALGLPETLVHGDLHPGNVAHHGEALMLYDWSDAAVSHPFLDAVHLLQRIPELEKDATRDAYAGPWRAAYPDVDAARGLELAAQVNTIFQMVTYEQLCRAIEDASYWEMRGVVARLLKQVPERFPAAGV